MSHTQSQHLRIINYVPLAISVSSFLPISRWELLPGVWLEKIPEKLKEKIAEIDSKSFPKINIRPNYAVRIENIKYTNGLKKRLSNEGKSLPLVPKDVDPILPDAKNLAKLIVISLILQKSFSFSIANAYSFEIDASNTKVVKYQNIGIDSNRTEECLRLIPFFFPPRESKLISRKSLSFTILLLERYFRPYIWSVDRLSVALSCLWNALTARNIAQSFLNLTIMIECLLSTSKNEIAHIISERAAIMIGKTSKQQVDIYLDCKKIYSQRSKIVHGAGVPKKGSLNWDSFIISTKLSIIPQNLMKKLMDYAFKLLTAIINNPEIMKIIQSDKKEGAINKELDSFYLHLLMKKK